MINPANPLEVAGIVLGALVSIPAIFAVVKFIFFLAKLDNNFDQIMTWMNEMKDWKHEIREKAQEFELRIDRLERNGAVPRVIP